MVRAGVSRDTAAMFHPVIPDLVPVAFIFFAAGAVKGILGMGLPTVAVGLLGLVMPVAQAAALLTVPSLATNVWQAGRGPHLARLARRLWPMQAGVAAGVLAGAGLMNPGNAARASMLLGACLAAYGAAGALGLRLPPPRPSFERAAGALAGAATGLVTAATGVFVLPAVPYLQSLGLDKDEMSQALGLSFTVSTLALGAVLAQAGELHPGALAQSAVVLAPALLGMAVGQMLRDEMSQAAFRRALNVALVLLGTWLLARNF